MGAAKDEAVGTVKKNVGKVVDDDELRRRGEDQIEEGVEQDEAEQAQRLGHGFGSEPAPAPYEDRDPGNTTPA